MTKRFFRNDEYISDFGTGIMAEYHPSFIEPEGIETCYTYLENVPFRRVN